MSGPAPTATVLRLIRGDTHKSRLKDDRPKVDAPPQLPPGVALTEPERATWDWLIQHVYLPGVHGTADGPMFLKVTRLLVRANECDAKIQQFGLVMLDPKSQKPMLQPYTRLSRDLWKQVGIGLGEIGATPGGRVKLAGPRITGLPGDPKDWDGID